MRTTTLLLTLFLLLVVACDPRRKIKEQEQKEREVAEKREEMLKQKEDLQRLHRRRQAANKKVGDLEREIQAETDATKRAALEAELAKARAASSAVGAPSGTADPKPACDCVATDPLCDCF